MRLTKNSSCQVFNLISWCYNLHEESKGKKAHAIPRKQFSHAPQAISVWKGILD